VASPISAACTYLEAKQARVTELEEASQATLKGKYQPLEPARCAQEGEAAALRDPVPIALPLQFGDQVPTSSYMDTKDDTQFEEKQ
jgi:hypothetical protein